MSEIVSPAKPRRWWPVLIGVVVVAGAVAWGIRVAFWPCGMLDSSSGCVSRVKLDLSGTGLDPDTAQVAWRGFDLGPEGKTALVELAGPSGAGTRGILATFDAATGKLITTVYTDETANDDTMTFLFNEAAFSADGGQVALMALDPDADERSGVLNLYRSDDGSLIRKVADESDCMSMLDFSPDGTRLQCSHRVHDLTTGEVTSAIGPDNMMLPMYADFAPGDRAPDGTVVAVSDLPSRTALFDADTSMIFAPDSVGLLEVVRAYRENRGHRWWTPAPFRYLSGVGVWDGKTKVLIRRFYANERYRAEAWARDGSHFGFVSDDLYLTVFKR